MRAAPMPMPRAYSLDYYYGDESIEATAQKLQCTVPLHLTYYYFDHDWTGSITRSDIQAGRIPFVDWEVFNAKLDDIIAGVYDNMLAMRAKDAKALGAQIFVDFGAEMNGDWSPWGALRMGTARINILRPIVIFTARLPKPTTSSGYGVPMSAMNPERHGMPL